MLVQLTRFVFILAGAVAGYQLGNEYGLPGLTPYKFLALIIYVILGSAIGYVLGGVVGRRLSRTLAWIEDSLQSVPLSELIFGVLGLVVGLIVAFLASLPLGLIPPQLEIVRLFLTVFLYVVSGWLGVRLAARRHRDFDGVLGMGNGGAAVPRAASTILSRKIVDTNVIIDGRISDICNTGFVEGELILPRFVLHELQMIADSEDPLRRNRGRRGLDVLNELQRQARITVSIVETDFPQVIGVDAKLVRLAREMGASILTNDYNLNKVAEIEGIRVFNINELANAVKPIVLPGEELAVKVIREGKEADQGVGYLDDGTMVVVDGGGDRLGETVQLMVTSVLQTPAGRMIFAKLKVSNGR